MLAVIDESGDPGFVLDSSPCFVVVMVIFKTFEDAQAVAAAVSATKRALSIRRELKFNGSNDRVRDGFFQAMKGLPFRVQAVIVDKRFIRDQEIRSKPKQLAFFAMRQLIVNNKTMLKSNAVIKIDRYGEQSVRNVVATFIRQHLPAGSVKSLKFVDSKHDVLIQLADMVAGAVARPYNGAHNKTPTKWRDMIVDHIDKERVLGEA